MNNVLIPVLTNATLIAATAGVYLVTDDEEPRMLKFRLLYRDTTVPIQVSYSAGYAGPANIPPGLKQAANAYAAEIYRSAQWVGFRSKSMQGETVNYETGSSWGMSEKIKAMLQPYRNFIPFVGSG